MPNLLPRSILGFTLSWLRPAGRLFWGSVVLLIGLAILGYLIRRPKPERPATWAECMAGAVGAFGMFLVAYAVIPHEWITFSDKYLQWTPDKYLFQSTQSMFGAPWNWPFNLPYQALRDVIAAGIYIVFFSANLYLFSVWQKRGTAAPAETATPTKRRFSRFGRPLKVEA